MLYRAIRWIVLSLVRLFYPHIEVQGREHLPVSGPVIFVANHANGLLDPLLVTVCAGRPVRFLAGAHLAHYPGIKQCLDAFGALTVHRRSDRNPVGNSMKSLVEQNEPVFARCRSILQQQGALALFPEGTTHSGSKLLRLRSGAARIGLGAEAENDWQLGVQVVPIGLWYQDKTLFRSAVLVVVGEPLLLSDYTAAYREQPINTVRTVTGDIAQRLSAVVLQAENHELLTAMPVIAAWTYADHPPATLAERNAHARALLNAYMHLSTVDPARLEGLARQARRYARTLRVLGITEPWVLEVPPVGRYALVRRATLLLLGSPLALLGFIFSYAPYRAARPIAQRLAAGDDTQVGHFKLISGAVLVFCGWLLTSLVVAKQGGIRRALLLFVAQPFLGYAALRWGEAWHQFREAVRYGWLRQHHRSLTQHLIERRHALATMMTAAVESMDGAPFLAASPRSSQ